MARIDSCLAGGNQGVVRAAIQGPSRARVQPDISPVTAESEGAGLAALVGPAEGQAPAGVSSKVLLFHPERANPITVQLPSAASSLVAAGAEGITAMLAGDAPETRNHRHPDRRSAGSAGSGLSGRGRWAGLRSGSGSGRRHEPGAFGLRDGLRRLHRRRGGRQRGQAHPHEVRNRQRAGRGHVPGVSGELAGPVRTGRVGSGDRRPSGRPRLARPRRFGDARDRRGSSVVERVLCSVQELVELRACAGRVRQSRQRRSRRWLPRRMVRRRVHGTSAAVHLPAFVFHRRAGLADPRNRGQEPMSRQGIGGCRTRSRSGGRDFFSGAGSAQPRRVHRHNERFRLRRKRGQSRHPGGLRRSHGRGIAVEPAIGRQQFLRIDSSGVDERTDRRRDQTDAG